MAQPPAEWKTALQAEWNRRQVEACSADQPDFPLKEVTYDFEEISAMVEVFLGGQLTMGPKVREFEDLFAKKVGARFAVMVNSGSSANLLAWSAAVNPQRSTRLKAGDEVMVSAVCWSTRCVFVFGKC